MTPEQWAALLVAIGAGAIGRDLVGALIKWLGGKVGRERDVVAYERARAKEEQDRADELDRKLDFETRVRRKTQEYAARLRRQAIENGTPVADLPPWPSELLDNERNP